ncbi:MAG: serine/threonine-protein kinase, partial [Nocardioidaceae bacterium]
MTTTPSGPTPMPRVGDYRLLTRIGEGGMGVVHLAATPDGRRVALKVLRPHVVGDDEARERLAREVASLRKVSSRHVAEVLDADPWGETPYIVTRYVPGHALFESVRRDGPLGLDDLEHTGRRLLEAVRDVHAADVMHRDLKPTNVVMEGRSPILIDFGLARLAEDPRLTATGWLLGTPGYLAPEVLFGDDATRATDVHGWAATLAYAATGESPYGRGHTMAILDRTRRGQVDLRAVPVPLRPLLAACLSTEPLDRPTTTE